MRRKESPDRASSFGVLSGKQDGAGARGGANEDPISSGHPLSLIPPGALEHKLYQSCPSMRQGVPLSCCVIWSLLRFVGVRVTCNLGGGCSGEWLISLRLRLAWGGGSCKQFASTAYCSQRSGVFVL